MKGWIILLVVILIFAGWIFYNNPETLQNLKNFITKFVIPSSSTGQTKEEATCISQINEKIDILKAKLPSDSIISIVNVKSFLPSDNITDWIKTWSSAPNLFGNLVPIDCQNTNPSNEPYICKDLDKVLSSGIFGSNETICIGVALRIESPSTSKPPLVMPLLCDGNGNLLENSKNLT